MNENLCIKGCVYRLSHDSQLDVDRDVSTAENRSSSCLSGTSQYLSSRRDQRNFFLGGGGGAEGDRLISFRRIKKRVGHS